MVKKNATGGTRGRWDGGNAGEEKIYSVSQHDPRRGILLLSGDNFPPSPDTHVSRRRCESSLIALGERIPFLMVLPDVFAALLSFRGEVTL